MKVRLRIRSSFAFSKYLMMSYSKSLFYSYYPKGFWSLLLFLCYLWIGNAQQQTESSQKIMTLPNENENKLNLSIPNESENNPLLRKDFLNVPVDVNIDNPVYRKKNSLKMEEEERFLDSGDYYLSKLKNKKGEGNEKSGPYPKEQYLGDVHYDGEIIQVVVRDHDIPDGDYIKVLLNGKELIPSILLTEVFKKFQIKNLEKTFNTIDFIALSSGLSEPNTAEIRIFDEKGNLIAFNFSSLATGGKATYILVKE